MEKKTKSSIKVIDTKNIGTFIVSKQLRRKIDFLHKAIGSVEWSGILVYKTKSKSIRPMKNLIFVGYDIYLMDIGNGATTTFNYDPESVVDMYNQIPAAMDMNIGIIHSHHNMKAYHSGTDFDELVSNAQHYNYYLSLVVSFDGDYACKVAFPTQVQITSSYFVKDRNGKSVKVEEDTSNSSILLSPLTVVSEVDVRLETWFIERVISVKKAVANKPKTVVKGYQNNDDYWKKTGWNPPVDSSKTEEPVYKLPVKKEEIPALPFDDNFPPTYPKIDVFLVNLLTMGEYTGKDLFEKQVKIKDVIDELIMYDAEDYGQFKEMLLQNISIIHDNVFGTEETHQEALHVKNVITILAKYTSHARVRSVIKILQRYAYSQQQFV